MSDVVVLVKLISKLRHTGRKKRCISIYVVSYAMSYVNY